MKPNSPVDRFYFGANSPGQIGEGAWCQTNVENHPVGAADIFSSQMSETSKWTNRRTWKTVMPSVRLLASLRQRKVNLFVCESVRIAIGDLFTHVERLHDSSSLFARRNVFAGLTVRHIAFLVQ